MSKIKLRKVYIKLGSECNLRCKYCHVKQVSFDFNPEILPVLKKLDLDEIGFGGGAFAVLENDYPYRRVFG